MTKPILVRLCLGIAVGLAFAGGLIGASSKETPKSKPPGQKPAVRIDDSDLGAAPAVGRVLSYADVLEPAQKAVVSVYSTKIIKERIAINPFLRQFFGNIPDQERESRQEGLGSGVIVTADGYIRDIYEKLQVNTRGSAVAKALKEGLV